MLHVAVQLPRSISTDHLATRLRTSKPTRVAGHDPLATNHYLFVGAYHNQQLDVTIIPSPICCLDRHSILHQLPACT